MRRTRLAIPALGLALVLAACGGATTGAVGPNATAAPRGTSAPASTKGPDAPGSTSAPATQAPAGNGGVFTGRIADTQTHNDLLAILPAKLCGKKPGRYAFRGESWFQDTDPAALEELASYGKTVDDVIVAIEIVADENTCSAGIVRIKGLTPDQVRSINDKNGGDANAKEVTVDGRKVWLDKSEMGTAYFYMVGDAVVMASALDDEHAREVLALMPQS